MTSELTIANIQKTLDYGIHQGCYYDTQFVRRVLRQLLATMQREEKLLAECDKHVLKVANIAIENQRLRVALNYAVEKYGKEGGPWNVPSNPGGWLHMARKALENASEYRVGEIKE